MKRLVTLFLVSLVSLSLIFGAISCAKPSPPPTPPSVTPPTETPKPSLPAPAPPETTPFLKWKAGKIAFIQQGAIWLINPESGEKIKFMDWPYEAWGLSGIPLGLWSPDSKRFAYTKQEGEKWMMYITEIDGPNRKIAKGVPVAWSPDGKKILYNDGGLYVVNTDGTGERIYINGGAENVFWSQQGDEILLGAIYIVNSDGTIQFNLKVGILSSGSHMYPWSPDGQKIVYRDGSHLNDLFLINSDGTNKIHLMKGRVVSWSPDGKWILGADWSERPYRFNQRGEDKTEFAGSPTPERNSEFWSGVWSPDGKGFIYSQDQRVFIADVECAQVINLTEGCSPYWSPDGKKICYLREDKFGDYYLYVINSDGTAKKKLAQVSRARPIWLS